MKKIVFLILFAFSVISIVYGQEESVPIDLHKAVASGGEGRELSTYDLLRTEGSEAVPFLVPYLLNDPYPKVRAIIAEGLGKYGDASVAVPALMKAREDKSPEVREKVAMALINRGYEKEAVDMLIRLVKEKKITGFIYDKMNLYAQNEDFKGKILGELENIKNSKTTDDELKAYAIIALKINRNDQISENDFMDITKAITSDSHLNGIYIGQLTDMAIRDQSLEKRALELIQQIANTTSDRLMRKMAENRIKNFNYVKELQKGGQK